MSSDEKMFPNNHQLNALVLAMLLGALVCERLSAQFSPADVAGQHATGEPAPHAHLPFEVFPAYDTKESIIARLRSAPQKLYQFDRALLPDVLRFLADDAGIPFFSTLQRAPGEGPGQHTNLDSTLVTFSMRGSPFTVLESIAKANNIALHYESGLWVIRPINESEMIGRTYRLKYTPQERVTFDAAAGGAGGQAGTMGQTASIPNIQRQQSQAIFNVEEPALVEEIKNILKIPSGSLRGRVAEGDASVGNFPPLPEAGGSEPFWSGDRDRGEPTVTFNSDTNSIYIVATRQQHEWVEGFLAAADRPQALIGIEVKFFETSKDPRSDIGVNWAGITENFELRAQDIRASPSGTVEFTSTSDRQARSGAVAPGQDTFDFTDSERNMRVNVAAPYSAVLSTSNLSLALQALVRDTDTTLVQYPRVLTVNNREVAISNAVNQPILGSSQQSQTGGSTQTTNTVEYLPIGTQLNILPKTMPDGSVFLTVAITISNRLRDEPLNVGGGAGTNLFPVTASRVYQAALQVDSGYTLAVGGLEESFDDVQRTGVPLLRDIPGLGELFKSTGKRRNRRNLLVFITPSVIEDRRATTGLPEQPVSIVPQRGPSTTPRPPAFTPDGNLAGGVEAIPEAIRWLQHQLRIYRQLNHEKNVDRQTVTRIDGILNTAGMLQNQIDAFRISDPGRISYLDHAAVETATTVADLLEVQSAVRRNIIF